jgi:TolB-like protein/Tfp pilus assembly protein PilF
VALKFLPSELTQNKEAKQRFIQEAQAAAALNHPNICIIHEIDEADGRTFISMEYIEGQTLKDKLASGTIAIDDAVDLAIQVAQGLEKAHKTGIVHRDIKPANVMINQDGIAKITDFGLAKLSGGVDLTRTSTLMGTVAYMSPEQARGEEVDHRTDIWSLGAISYEMLTGKHPFGKRQDHSLLYAILNEKPKLLSFIRPDIPRPIERVVLKTLEKDPARRHQSMSEMLDDMRAARSTATVAPAPQKSIAVLPFLNMSADPENEYFSDGLTEELINALTKIRDLRVVARTSSFAFKGEKIDIREVGEKLKVTTLLEGSVRRAGNRLRITAQLINVADGFHLWSDRFDREMEDVFAIQDEITEKIVDTLKAELQVSEEVVRMIRPHNMEAYDHYLKGRYHSSKFLIDKAMAYYNRAIALDPDYAPAHAALAESYVLLSTGFDVLPNSEAMPRAREAAQKALEIDPTLAEAHVSLGLVATCYDWDRRAARKHFQKAIELNPNSAGAHQWIEFLWTYLEGDIDRAGAAIEHAQDLDPMNILIKIRIGYMHIFRRHFDRAIDFFQNLLELEPNLHLALHGLIESYGLKGMLTESLAFGEKMMEQLEPSQISGAHLGVFGFYAAQAGQKARANQLLAELEDRSREGYTSNFWMAVIHHGLGERDKAFELFNQCIEERDGNMIYITIPPPFDSLRSDPRYEELLRKMNLENLLETKPWSRTYVKKT